MAKPDGQAGTVGEDVTSRPERFMRSALAILGETGRTDFTVLEVVERSKTSLRSFYQHFSTKDELLLALIERIMSESARHWRAEADRLTGPDALRTLIDRICVPPGSDTQDRVNRGLTSYNDRLAEAMPRKYAKVLAPLHALIADIIRRGVSDGDFRDDLDVEATSALIMQAALGAMRLRVLGAELSGAPVDARHIYDFLRTRRERTALTLCPRLSLNGNVITARRQRDFQEADMPSRDLSFPVFDADNHFYEPKEALTQFLPDHRKGVIDYIDVRGRTKIVVRNHISDYIPNPTFEVVARPGAQEEYFKHGSGGKSFREVMGKPMKAIPAFRNPEARLEVLDGLGLDYTIMFPTLASLVEERLKDDPDLILDIIHALNQWMYETWQFNYEDRIFSTPVINLGIVDRALEELEWCLERGAKTVLVRPAPVPGYRGTRSLGLPEFDPFWAACVEAGIPVCMHASDSGYSQYLNDWEPAEEFLPFKPTAFRMVAMGKRPIEDTMAALVCHGALTRNPDLRVLSIENGASWVPYLFYQFRDVYSKMPQEFPEDPIAAFKRGVYVAPFWEDNFKQMADLIGVDRVIFGSDWPHPEGLADPIRLVDDLQEHGLDEEGIRKVMGGNLVDLFKVPNQVVHRPDVPALVIA
ncbi:amidohydrolase family protein [Mycolicibacterium litorale]|uniref:HTH tetR-type domain-containing protein n=2 Tax=Mycolicibacterium litorale TaxID=758802 RepID=A0AAD1IKC0_9MYCO|nr:amidohydrolase family protein [Mycolicibacterium litorale]TDY08437.1 TetR family transcriptional regulator [Mycolicibacterium litorale]BBY16361.1 hypothetical protein MLIT_19530 [Mycolicibacterium litorale]